VEGNIYASYIYRQKYFKTKFPSNETEKLMKGCHCCQQNQISCMHHLFGKESYNHLSLVAIKVVAKIVPIIDYANHIDFDACTILMSNVKPVFFEKI